jgi:hypothetical protein
MRLKASRDVGAMRHLRGAAISQSCAIIRGMGYFNHSAKSNDSAADLEAGLEDTFSPLQWLGMATAFVGAVSLGLYIGRELRLRYKFRRRTPADFFSNAGDPIASAEYGMGI